MVASYFNPANDYAAQHEDTLHTTAKFFRNKGPCVPISKHMIVKTGFSVHLMEAATMQYVARHTTIPVPKVYSSFLRKNQAYIIMERIRGDDLATIWKTLSKESLENIFSQLKTMIQELRSLKPSPNLGVGSCIGGSLYDSRLPNGTPRFGPFKTIQDFHGWLRDDIKATQIGSHVTGQDVDDIKAMIARQEGEWANPTFTHCDLNPSNILIRGHEIVGILDWEFSGWYPSYWEYTSAWLGNRTRVEWQGILLSLLDPYPEELEMEKTRSKWWGEW